MPAVIIPHGLDDDPVRVKVREFVADRWRRVHGITPILAPCPTVEWSKGAAANPSIAASSDSIIIVADADSYVDDDRLIRAVDHARDSGWAMPHSYVKRVSQKSTAAVLAGRDERIRLERGSYPALPGGGIVIARTDAWEAVNGFDPRFIGWGGEDHALGLAFNALVGPVNARRHGVLWHLWHPPAATCRKPAQASRDLDARYVAARRHPELMANLVKEW